MVSRDCLGPGRSESVRAIFAADKVTGGDVRVNGKRGEVDEADSKQ
jgi:monosaccharide-transporting ATPase